MDREPGADASVGVHTPDLRGTRSSKLAAAALLATVVGAVLLGLGFVGAAGIFETLLPFGGLLLVGGGVVGTVANARIKQSDGGMRGRSKAIAATVLGCAAPALSTLAVMFFIFYTCK